MAQLVSILGVTHNPFFPRLFRQERQPPGARLVQERLALLRERLDRAAPEVLVMVGNDHLNQFFMDNMPAFIMGRMQRYDGIFYNEIREFGLTTCSVQGDPVLSRHILEGALDHGVDFAYSNELRLDHSIVVPLMLMRPQMDLPIVPILSNCIAPPLPRAARFHQVGGILRTVLDQLPDHRRVAVVISGHLSLEIGAGRMFEPNLCDAAFDHQAVEWVRSGNAAEATRECSFDNLARAGNMSHAFMNFLLAMGLAKDQPTAYAEGLDAGFAAVPFFAWEPEAV